MLENCWSDPGDGDHAHHERTRTVKTYVENLVATLEAADDATVLERDGAKTTGAQLLASMYRYARAIDGIGIGRGDLVALHAPNSPDALAVRYAAHLLGAATMYLPALPTPQQRAALVEFVAPDLLVAFPETAHLLTAGVPAGSRSSAATSRSAPPARPAGAWRLGRTAAVPRPPGRPGRDHLLGRLDRGAEGQHPLVRPLHRGGRRPARPGSPAARQRPARPPDPVARRHHAARRRHGGAAGRRRPRSHAERDRVGSDH